jgi:hypothetical protein
LNPKIRDQKMRRKNPGGREVPGAGNAEFMRSCGGGLHLKSPNQPVFMERVIVKFRATQRTDLHEIVTLIADDRPHDATDDKQGRSAAHRFYERLGFSASHEGMKRDL